MFNLQCWNVGGFSPGVLIFRGPNGSLLTAGMLKPEPIPLKLPEVNGPERTDNPQLDTSKQATTLKYIFIDDAKDLSLCLAEES